MPTTRGDAVADDDVGVLVLLDADAVAGAVDEPLAVPGVGDDVAGGGVDGLRRGADPAGRHRGGLGLVEHRVDLGHLGGRLTGDDAAGDVGAVAGAAFGEHGAAEVAQHDLAGGDDPRARLVVGAGRVLAGRHDGEVHPLVALGQDAAAEVGRHLGLGAPDERDAAGLELGGDAVDGGGRPAQGLHLVGVLDLAERADDLGGGGEGGGRSSPLQGHEELGPGAVADGGGVRPARAARPRWRRGRRSRPTDGSGTRRRATTTRGTSRPGTTSVATPSRGTTSMVSRSRGMAS